MVGSEAVSRLRVDIPWHSLSSPNSEFPPSAKQLWGGDVSWRTALAYDAASALITALQQLPQPNRTGVKEALVDASFQATGATGNISFRKNGERNQPVVESVKVMPSKCLPYGFRFVPVSYGEAKVEDLERTCRS
jgi:branched-chain amino acid transport system substrate-binding protein